MSPICRCVSANIIAFFIFLRLFINQIEPMTLQEAIIARHSVRQYTEQHIEAEKIQQLQDFINECNREGGLHIQLVTDEPNAFSNIIAHYSKFHGVRNYIAMICKKGDDVNLGAETFRHFRQLRVHRPRHRQVPF